MQVYYIIKYNILYAYLIDKIKNINKLHFNNIV